MLTIGFAGMEQYRADRSGIIDKLHTVGCVMYGDGKFAGFVKFQRLCSVILHHHHKYTIFGKGRQKGCDTGIMRQIGSRVFPKCVWNNIEIFCELSQ